MAGSLIIPTRKRKRKEAGQRQFAVHDDVGKWLCNVLAIDKNEAVVTAKKSHRTARHAIALDVHERNIC
jgi:hypothetical protein